MSKVDREREPCVRNPRYLSVHSSGRGTSTGRRSWYVSGVSLPLFSVLRGPRGRGRRTPKGRVCGLYTYPFRNDPEVDVDVLSGVRSRWVASGRLGVLDLSILFTNNNKLRLFKLHKKITSLPIVSVKPSSSSLRHRTP